MISEEQRGDEGDEDEQDAIADALAMARALKADGGAPQDTPVEAPGAPHPYATLTPERVLDAIETIGLRCDGRLLTLNSYENRVYLVGLDDGSQCVAKFYRPGRWSDGQILEEHRFVDALVECEVPVVPARIDPGGDSLHHHEDFRFALFDRRGGRAPEIERRDTREWLGRFIGRIHALGTALPYVERPALDRETFGVEPRDWIVGHRIVPEPLAAVWAGVVDQALAGIDHC